MKRVFLFGIVCAALAALVIVIGNALNFTIQNVMLGIGGGAILGLVRTHSPAMRYIACLIGFALGFAFYAIRLAVLPATIWGNLIAVVVTILLVTLIAGLTKDKIPMWGMFVGVTVFAGAFDQYFTTTPWLFVNQSITTIATMLFAVTAGFLVSVLVELRVKHGEGEGVDPMAPAQDASAQDTLTSADAEGDAAQETKTGDQTDDRSLSAVGLGSGSEDGDKA